MTEPVQLVIQLTPTGQVSVSGPIANRTLCYGMLEMARDAIHAYDPAKQMEQPSIVLARAMPNLNGNGRN